MLDRLDGPTADGQSSACRQYFQSRMGWAVLFEVRIARTRSGYENCRGLVTCEGEVGCVRGLCIERALRQHTRLIVVGLAAISKVPRARDNHCKPIIAVGVRCDVGVRRYLELDGIRASPGRIARQHNCLNSPTPDVPTLGNTESA